jgi:hypothetical protein
MYGSDPLTGLIPFNFARNATDGVSAVCEPCENNDNCNGFTGFLGGVFCVALADNQQVCLQDCTDNPTLCPDGYTCDASGNCLPEGGNTLDACSAVVANCDENHPNGSCQEGAICFNGTCYTPPKSYLLETEPTFMLKSDIFWYGFIFTTASFSTRFNDQLNVFRPGTPGTVALTDQENTEQITFVDPDSGVSYAAVQPKCPKPIVGGSVGLYGRCNDSFDCVGDHSGAMGEVYCEPFDPNDQTKLYCLQDCTEDASLCAANEVCTDAHCVPMDNMLPVQELCSPEAPKGKCASGQTCVDGLCLKNTTPTGVCAVNGNVVRDTMAVRLLKKANLWAQEYQTAATAYAQDDGNQANSEQITSAYYRTRYRLRYYVEMLETLRATYSLFGQVF